MGHKQTTNVMLAPNKAIPFDHEKLIDRYPMYGSIKYDGLRLFISKGQALTRRLRPCDNHQILVHLKTLLAISFNNDWCFDGEFYSHSRTFQKLSSLFRRQGAKIPPDIKFHCFDMFTQYEYDNNSHQPYHQRLLNVYSLFGTPGDQQFIDRIHNCQAVEQTPIKSPKQAQLLFDNNLKHGYEGLMLRGMDSPYKKGRCTLNEGYLLKFKQFVTMDGLIEGFIQREQMKACHLNDPRRLAERSNTGHQKRHHFKDMYEPINEIGSYGLLLPDGTSCHVTVARGVKLPITWENRNNYIGKWVEFKYMKIGMKDKPRMGAITRMRPDLD